MRATRRLGAGRGPGGGAKLTALGVAVRVIEDDLLGRALELGSFEGHEVRVALELGRGALVAGAVIEDVAVGRDAALAAGSAAAPCGRAPMRPFGTDDSEPSPSADPPPASPRSRRPVADAAAQGGTADDGPEAPPPGPAQRAARRRARRGRAWAFIPPSLINAGRGVYESLA